MKVSSWIAALAYAGAAFLFGLALGERGELGVVQHVFTFVVPLATAALALFARRNRIQTVLTGLAILGGVVLGQRQFADAWDDCVIRGESVRVALARLDDYPARLEELPMSVPCRAGFRPTILHYMSNERGFRLWMTNDRTTFIGTDELPFTASGRSSGPASRR